MALKKYFKDEDYYTIHPVTGCWIFNGCLGRGGYGKITVQGSRRTVSAHIYFYEKKYGPVPVDLELDHIICSVRRCCNPDHVLAVSRKQNARRRPNCILSMEIAETIRKESAAGTPGKKLALKYKVSPSMISGILQRTRWA
jgi:hypothetical protein